jgi:hypothetical protein
MTTLLNSTDGVIGIIKKSPERAIFTNRSLSLSVIKEQLRVE